MRTLKGIRVDLGMTQAQMADNLGISVSQYRKKEGYRVGLSAFELLKIAELAGVDPRVIKVVI